MSLIHVCWIPLEGYLTDSSMETCLLLVKLHSSYDMKSKESYIPKTEQFDKKNSRNFHEFIFTVSVLTHKQIKKLNYKNN